jgi:hypothetical protein
MTRFTWWFARHPNTAFVLRAGYYCLVELGKTQAVVPEVILHAPGPGQTAGGGEWTLRQIARPFPKGATP